MFRKLIQNGIAKEVIYSLTILSVYLFNGVNRSYLAYLFHQLDSTRTTISVNDEQKSWIAAFTNLLSPLGCIIVGIMTDTFGRKVSLQGVYIPFIISYLMIAFAKNVTMFYIAALIQSISTGMSYSTSIYVSEISTAQYRGALLGTIEIPFNFGVLLCSILMCNLKWSTVSLIFAVISTITLLLTFILPESPTWLYLKGRKEEFIDTLESIRCKHREAIKSEIDEMENYMSSHVETKPSETIKNCLRSWRQFVIVLTMFILQQNTGYAILTMFIIMIVNRLQIPYRSTNVALLYSCTCSICGFLTPYVMYKFNRKPLLAISAIGMSICAAAVPIYQYFSKSSDEKPFSWVIPVVLCMYVLSCSLGVVSVGFTVSGELFPNEVRGVMNGVQGAMSYFYCSLLYKISPWYLATFGASGVMWTFAAFSMIMASFSYLVLPETKGKTLNEVQEEYFKKKR